MTGQDDAARGDDLVGQVTGEERDRVGLSQRFDRYAFGS